MMTLRKSNSAEWSRRDALAAAASMVLMWAVPARADEAGSGPLPLQTTGLEHK